MSTYNVTSNPNPGRVAESTPLVSSQPAVLRTVKFYALQHKIMELRAQMADLHDKIKGIRTGAHKWSSRQFHEYQIQFSYLSADCNQLECDQTNELLQQAIKQIIKYKKDCNISQTAQQQLKSQYEQTQLQVVDLQQENEQLKDTIEGMNENQDEMEDMLSESFFLEEKVSDLKDEKKSLWEFIELQSSHVDLLNKHLKENEELYQKERNEWDRCLPASNKSYVATIHEQARLMKENDKLQQEIASKKRKLSELDQESSKLEEENTAKKRKLSKLDGRIKHKQEEFELQTQQHQQFALVLASKQTETNRALQACDKQIDDLKKMLISEKLDSQSSTIS